MIQLAHPAETWPVERTVDIVGDAWTLLILRDSLFFGARTFTDFEDTIAVSKRALGQRLRALVASGVLARELPGPRRSEPSYVPTSKGADLWVVIAALSWWGNRWITDDVAADLVLVHRRCQSAVTGGACGPCGLPLTFDDVTIDWAAYTAAVVDELVRLDECSTFGLADTAHARRALRRLARSGVLDGGDLLESLARRTISPRGLRTVQDLLADGSVRPSPSSHRPAAREARATADESAPTAEAGTRDNSAQEVYRPVNSA